MGDVDQSVDEAFHPIISVDSRVGFGEVEALNGIELVRYPSFHHIPPADGILADCRLV
jgi:hypothetical protein